MPLTKDSQNSLTKEKTAGRSRGQIPEEKSNGPFFLCLTLGVHEIFPEGIVRQGLDARELPQFLPPEARRLDVCIKVINIDIIASQALLLAQHPQIISNAIPICAKARGGNREEGEAKGAHLSALRDRCRKRRPHSHRLRQRLPRHPSVPSKELFKVFRKRIQEALEHASVPLAPSLPLTAPC